MKKVIVFFFILNSFISFSQTIDGVDISDMNDISYIELYTGTRANDFVTIYAIDYGQGITAKGFDMKPTIIKNSSGEVINFISGADALNKLKELGWTCIEKTNFMASTNYFYAIYTLERISKE